MVLVKNLIEYGFYLFIFLLPWQTRLIWQEASLNGFTWEYGRLSLYGTEILLWAVLFLYGFWLLRTRRLQKIEFKNFSKKLQDPGALIYLLVILIVLTAGVSVIFSLLFDISFHAFFKLVELVAMMSMILVFGFTLKRVAVVWVAAAVVQSFFAIWQFFIQYVPANKWLGLAWHYSTVGGSIILQTADERWLRAYGSLPHPNMLGGFLVIALLFLLYLAFIAEKFGERILILGSLIFLIPALFFSFSRSAWVALIVCLVLLGLWLLNHQRQVHRRIFFQTIFLILILTSVLAVNLWQPLLTRLQGKEPLEVNSIELRYTFNQQALEVIKDHPLSGTGIGNYTYGVYQSVNGSWPGYYYQPVHNVYLLVLAELGIFGWGLFVATVLLLFIGLIRQAASLDKAISFLAFLSILIIGLFDHYFWTMFFGAAIFWLIFGINLRQLKGLDKS